MAEQEACAELVRSTAGAGGDAETAETENERGESLLLPLLQGLLDRDSAGGGQRLLAGLGTGDADVVADVRRALKRLRAVLTDSATEKHPSREALLALVDRLEDGLDASADRLDGCKRQNKTRRRSRNFRHTVGVTREELEVARRLVDESDLEDIKVKNESHTPVSTPAETPKKENDLSYQNAVTETKKPPPISHSISYEGPSSTDVVRRSEPINKDKIFRHSIANGVPDASSNKVVKQAAQYQQPLQPHQTENQRIHHQYPQQYNPYAPHHKSQPQNKNQFVKPQQTQYPPQYQPVVQTRGSSKENFPPRAFADNHNSGGSNEPQQPHTDINGFQQPPKMTVTAPKDNIFQRAPLYRPPPPGYNFTSVQQTEESRPVGRFSSNKKNRMKRANTIDIPKPLNFYRIESDTEDEGASRVNRNSIEAPTVPPLQPKTDNDHKFLAFIQKNNPDNTAPWSPAKAAAAQGQNWNSCFGNIKNAFESQSQVHDRSRSSSSSSARNFWKTADDQCVNPVKPPNYGPRLSRKSVQDLQQMHANKTNSNQQPWASATNGNVVSASLRVTGPNHSNIVQAPAKPSFVAKPIPVNQFSHAPMSAFKPPKKMSSPVMTTPHVWSPPSYERNVSSERMYPPQNLNINDSYVPSKPVLKSPTSAPWLANNSDKPKRVLSLAASKFENHQQKQPSPTYNSAPPAFKPKSFVPFENHNSAIQPYQNYHVKNIPSQTNLAAPQLVKNFNTNKQNHLERSHSYVAPPIDIQKSQIEFYEKQVLENAKKKPSNGHFNKFNENLPPQNAPSVYTVTNYSPVVTTFVPLQQTPDIEKAKAHKVDYLPDVVLNENNQYSNNEIVQSPSIQYSEFISRPNYLSMHGSASNGSNYPEISPGFQNGNASPCQYLEPQYDSALSPGDYDPTEYTTVTRVMRGPAPQQATIKSGVTTRNGEAFRGSAAKSLKGVLQKFSSPKHEVLSQIERKKKEQRALNGPSGGFQVSPPQVQPQRMENRPVYNQRSVNTHQNFSAPPTPPHDPEPKPVPIIKYNNVPSSPPVRPAPESEFEARTRSGLPVSRELVQSTESLDRSSKPPSPAVNKPKAFSPQSQCSTTPSSPAALSKSESWHQIVESASDATSPRASPRKVVARAKSMHLLSVPKLFEGGIAQEKLSEKRKTVEAYFSGHASPQSSLSKSNSQQTIPDSVSPASGSQSPRSKHSVSHSKSSEKRSFSLGRSRTMPTINDLKFLDESNADDAFENLLKETLS